MEFAARGCRPKNGNKIKNLHGGRLTGLNSHTLLVINLPDSRVWRVLSRSVFLAMVILVLPGVGSIFKGPSESNNNGSDLINSELLNLLFQDLAGEGLLRKGDKALIVSAPGNEDMILHNLQDLHKNEEVDVAIDSDFEKQSSISNETFDFVFTSSFVDTTFVNRVLKIGGIVALPLSNNPPNVFRQQSNYKLVYLRRYSCTIMALKKISPANELVDSSTKRHLCKFASDAKKVVLKGLEDVLLEPPRLALAKSNYYLSKIKFLPDLLGDSLEGYKRRVFIGVGLAEENSGVIEWFHENYPKRNQEFEDYSLEEDCDISDWLKKNVKEGEYVVMKAEAEVVEEMMKRRTMHFVDELFLECNNQWWQGEEKSKSKRAYWECLALYGRLRDEGVAVHQWWG